MFSSISQIATFISSVICFLRFWHGAHQGAENKTMLCEAVSLICSYVIDFIGIYYDNSNEPKYNQKD